MLHHLCLHHDDGLWEGTYPHMALTVNINIILQKKIQITELMLQPCDISLGFQFILSRHHMANILQ